LHKINCLLCHHFIFLHQSFYLPTLAIVSNCTTSTIIRRIKTCDVAEAYDDDEDDDLLYSTPPPTKTIQSRPKDGGIYDAIDVGETAIIFEPYEIFKPLPPPPPRKGPIYVSRTIGRDSSSVTTTSSSTTPIASGAAVPPPLTGDRRLSAVSREECCAPAGRLGVSIDTVGGRPVVHRVNDDSPMIGVLRHRDVIVSVDKVDTSFISATEVTVLMAKRIQEERRITFLRKVDEGF